MAIQVINVGAAPNDGTGDPIRTAYIKCNDNFGELYSRAQVNPPATLVGTVGDEPGMYAYDASYFYYCYANYDGSSTIWAAITNTAIESYANIVNGNTTVSIPSANANVVVTVNQVSNVAVFTTAGLEVANLNASGAAVITGNLSTNTNLSVGGNATVSGNLTVSGNINGNLLADRIVNGSTSIDIVSAGANANVSVGGTTNTVVFSSTATTFAGNILPSGNITFDLGSSSSRWKDIWLSNSSIYLGNITVAATSDSLTVNGNRVITQTSNNTTTLGNLTVGNIAINEYGRIRAEFTDPFPNRVFFQTSNLANNAPTYISVVPGSFNANTLGAAFGAWNNIDIANAAVFGLYSYTNEARIQSLPFGTASLQNVTIHMGTTEVFRVNTVGNVGMGNSAPVDRLAVAGNAYVSNNVTAVGNVSANIVLSSTYTQTTPVAFASLPTAASAGSGARAFITDSNTITFAANAAGGGSNSVPVFSDGTVWKIG